LRYLKTEAGQLAFKQRSPEMSARQRSAFLQFDGQRRVAEVLGTMAGLGVTESDIQDMVTRGFLTPVETTSSRTEAAPVQQGQSEALSAEEKARRYQSAYPIAIRLTAGLGLRGFRLNLAVEAAGGYDDLLKLVPNLNQALGEAATFELRQALQPR
jgi:hypothetical protein